MWYVSFVLNASTALWNVFLNIIILCYIRINLFDLFILFPFDYFCADS